MTGVTSAPENAPRTRESAGPASGLRLTGGMMVVLLGQFLLVMAVAQAAYPGYSALGDYISDLGNSATSPLWWMFDLSAILLGAGTVAVAYRIQWLMPRGHRTALGTFFMASVGAGLATVGFSPENVNLALHTAGTLLFFVGLVVGLILWAAPIGPSAVLPRWNRTFALIAAFAMIAWFLVLDLVAGTGGTYTGGGGYVGLLERLAIAPFLLWMGVVGAQVYRAGSG